MLAGFVMETLTITMIAVRLSFIKKTYLNGFINTIFE